MESMCPRCFSIFNQSDHHLVILPCGDGICIQCFDDLMINPPDSKSLSSCLTCPMDQEQLTITYKFKENLKIIRRNLHNKLETGIYCDSHPNNPADYLYPKHETIICKTCVEQLHDLQQQQQFTSTGESSSKQKSINSPNKNKQLNEDISLVKLQRGDLENYLDTITQNLQEFSTRVQEAIKLASKLKKRKLTFLSQQFVNFVSEVTDILTGSHLKSSDEKINEINFFYQEDEDLPQNINNNSSPTNNDEIQAQLNLQNSLQKMRSSTIQLNKRSRQNSNMSNGGQDLDSNIFNTRSPKRDARRNTVSDKKRQVAEDYVYEVVENDSGSESLEYDNNKKASQISVQNRQNLLNEIIMPEIDNYSINAFFLEQDDEKLLKNWIGQNVKLQLIYRGTRDGFKAKSFHQKCDNQGPTLSLIKSEHEKVFGGFASISWQSDNTFHSDDKAFVFSLTHKTRHKQYQNKEMAVSHFSDILMLFGNSCDIAITNDCDNNLSSYCNLGMTYQPPEGYSLGEDKTKEYLAGSFFFKVQEIEVYKVIYI
eukprot:403345029